jgi:hypothetical protein
MLRLGYGRELRPVPRRSVEEVLRRTAPERVRADALALRTPPPASWSARGDRAPAP